MPKYKKYFQISFILSLVLLLILSLTPVNGSALDPLDKVAHFLMYFSITLPLTALSNSRFQIMIVILAAIVLGIAIEFIQEFIPGRGFEYWDIVANSSGAVFGVYFFSWKKEWIYNLLDKIEK